MPIDTTYKQHDIHATALEIEAFALWEPRFTVSYEEGSFPMIKAPFTYFTNRVAAESYAVSFAKKWLDDGKPKLG